MKKSITFRLLLLLIFVGTGSFAFGQHKTAVVPTLKLLPAGPAWGAVWQQKAAEYDALCFQAYNIAKLRLDELLSQTRDKSPVIVTDIDETVLDNSPYFIERAKLGACYTDPTWIQWTAREACDTVPGASAFLKYAASKGVIIYYITNRFQVEQIPTLHNLQHFNLPNADADHLILLNTEDSSKETRRLKVAANHDILLLIGDNLGDFSKAFDHLPINKRKASADKNASEFGKCFIVLPNNMYGGWEDAYYKNASEGVSAKNVDLSKFLK